MPDSLVGILQGAGEDPEGLSPEAVGKPRDRLGPDRWVRVHQRLCERADAFVGSRARKHRDRRDPHVGRRIGGERAPGGLDREVVARVGEHLQHRDPNLGVGVGHAAA